MPVPRNKDNNSAERNRIQMQFIDKAFCLKVAQTAMKGVWTVIDTEPFIIELFGSRCRFTAKETDRMTSFVVTLFIEPHLTDKNFPDILNMLRTETHSSCRSSNMPTDEEKMKVYKSSLDHEEYICILYTEKLEFSHLSRLDIERVFAKERVKVFLVTTDDLNAQNITC